MAIGYKHQNSGDVTTADAGSSYTFIDSADGKFKRKTSAGSVVDIESGGTPAASAVTNTPAGDIIATNVQAAINELDAEKAPITHVGSKGVAQHAVVDGTDAGFMSPSDKTKLDGIASAATANDTDANLKNRTNHTGTQTAATISDFTAAAKAAAVQDAISNGITDTAPSQNAVFDALALKSDTGHTHTDKANKSGDTFTGPVVVEGDNNGTGVVNLKAQSSLPATPASGVSQFASADEMFAVRGQSGFSFKLNDQNLTDHRQIDIPDADGPMLLDPTTTNGDLIARIAGVLQRIGIGGEDFILRSVGGIPSWQEENLMQDIGDGSDGSPTLTGSLTAPDNLYYEVLTLGLGGILNTDAYILYAKTLDLRNAGVGAIARNGNNGANTGGTTAAGAGGAAFTARVLATNAGGGAGAVGTAGAGVQGNSGGVVAVGNGGAGGASGTSGAGGTGIAANGISGGTVTTNMHFGRFEYQFLRGATQVGGGAGGRGGNCGGGDGTNASRGGPGGGAGGAVLVIIAGEIITGPSTPAGVIQARGGNGGSNTVPPNAGNVGGASGAGGGGGGYCYIAYVKKTGPVVTNLINCSGGNGGNGGDGFGTGTGGQGGAGGTGGKIQLFNITTGVGTLTVGSAGSLGSAASGITGGLGGQGGACVASL